MLSRGAAQAVFVDRRPDAVKLIRDNLEGHGPCRQGKGGERRLQEFLKGLREKFDIIFLDPPYAAGPSGARHCPHRQV